MNKYVLDVIVAGAGHAGLGASYFLKKYGLSHIVFERGKIGESWRSKRWDSFVLNSPNKFNVLPGDEYTGNNPVGFSTAAAFIASLEAHVEKFQLPVAENTKILSVEKEKQSGLFKVTVAKNNDTNIYYSRQVIIASGEQNERKVPAFTKHITPQVMQMHAGDYRAADKLPQGAVLVVGSAQSGCQIADDLIDAGRKVYLSTSMVARVPRRYRGKDTMEWLFDMHFFDARKEDITDPVMLEMKAPQMTGKDNGKTISLQSLAKKGVTILGKMETAAGKDLFFQPNAVKHIKFADEFSNNLKNMVDEFILKNRLIASLAEFDEADIADTNAACDSKITWLETEQHNINTIIWATGFNPGFSYIKLPVFDSDGKPKHTNGITNTEGLYFLGLPMLRTRKSGLIAGVKDDAEFICKKIYEQALKHELVEVS